MAKVSAIRKGPSSAPKNINDSDRPFANTICDQLIQADFAGAGEEQREEHDEVGGGPLDAVIRNNETAGFRQPVVVAVFPKQSLRHVQPLCGALDVFGRE